MRMHDAQRAACGRDQACDGCNRQSTLHVPVAAAAAHPAGSSGAGRPRRGTGRRRMALRDHCEPSGGKSRSRHICGARRAAATGRRMAVRVQGGRDHPQHRECELQQSGGCSGGA